jgi:hypothetical protein
MPKRRERVSVTTTENTIYANIAAHGTQPWRERKENRADGTAHIEQASRAEGLIVEKGKKDHTDCLHPTGGAIERNNEQRRQTTQKGEGIEYSTGQHPGGRQETGDAVEEGEVISNYTPVLVREIPQYQQPQEENQGTMNTFGKLNLESDKEEMNLDSTDVETSQRDVEAKA